MTIQAYLKEAPVVVDEVLAREKKPGIKLVRGAYMGPKFTAERGRIWDDKTQTDACYDDSLEQKLIGHIPVLTIATHNQESLRRASRLNRGGSNYPLDTATLLGMGDGLEVDEDLPQNKYVPYTGSGGSILGAAAYWSRRGTEFARNTVEGGITRGEQEFGWIDDELRRRNIPAATFKLITNVLLSGKSLPASR